MKLSKVFFKNSITYAGEEKTSLDSKHFTLTYADQLIHAVEHITMDETYVSVSNVRNMIPLIELPVGELIHTIASISPAKPKKTWRGKK